MKKKVLVKIYLIALILVPLNTAAAQDWVPMNSGISGNLWCIWGSAGNDIYASSADYGGQVIIHYNGNSWSTVHVANINLHCIRGTSSTDVFSAGSGTILHFNGSTWLGMNSGTSAILYGIWGSSATDVFAVGSAGTILHYNGNSGGVWSTMNSGTSNYLLAIWGSSSSDVYAVGSYGTILHYDGSTWSTIDSGAHTYGLNSIWGSSASDVYAVGAYGTILHYDGSTWSTINSGTTNHLSGIWGTSSSDIYAVGSNGTILHCNGSSWSTMNSGTTISLLSVWAGGTTDVVAVGESGTILHYASTTSSTTTTICDAASWKTLYENCRAELEEYQNQTATSTTPPTLIELSSLKVVPANGKVTLQWKTESEVDNAGFNVWKAEGFKKINPSIIPAQGSPTEGAEYDYLDLDVFNRIPYFYLIEDVDTNGLSTFHGPVKTMPRAIYGIDK